VMLETIREYAAESLEREVEFSASAHSAFAGYFAEFTEHQFKRLTGQGRETALKEMESEIENVRTAWRYWVEKKDLEQLTKFVNSLWLLYDARGWYHDTVSLTNDLLKLLASTPSTAERTQQQIMLQISLARALLETKGYTEEVERAYARALELCEGAGEVPQLFPILRGLASFHIFRMEYEKSIQMAERILALAEHLDDAEMKIEGQMILGYNLGFQDAQVGVAYLEKAVASYDLQRPRLALGLGPYPAVVGLTTSAIFLWTLGYPDRAHKRAADSILLARQMNHPFSITYAMFHSGLLNIWLKNYREAKETADLLLEVAEAHGFQIWRAVGSCLLGTTLVEFGSAEEGLALIGQGLRAYQNLKTPPVFWPMLLHLCASAYGAASQPATGLQMLNEAMEVEVASSKSADTFASEFLILKGALLLALSSNNVAEAQALYEQAVRNAQEVHAPMLQLRAAIRLSRLWQEQGDAERARTILSEPYSKITEGYATPDLKEASMLLTDLSESR
jgi:tetratricopeptide (TPR) repeat protein